MLIASVAFFVLVCALVRLATANDYVLVSALLIAGFLAFTVLQPLLFKLGALRAQEGQELYLSKFYLVEEMRGKGYARPMMRIVARRARDLGCDHVTLRVNHKNYQAILAYEHLGFVRVGELCTNIGNGFVMDDLVYELDLRGEA